jgi:hypothetical protein
MPPDDPPHPHSIIEDVLSRVAENERSRRLYREELAAVRGKQLAEVLAQVPEPDPTVIQIVVKDEATGKRFRLTLPATSVETRWE